MKKPSTLLQWIFRRELLTPPQKAFAGGSLWVGLGAAIMLFDEFLVFFVPFFCLELGVGTSCTTKSFIPSSGISMALDQRLHP